MIINSMNIPTVLYNDIYNKIVEFKRNYMCTPKTLILSYEYKYFFEIAYSDVFEKYNIDFLLFGLKVVFTNRRNVIKVY